MALLPNYYIESVVTISDQIPNGEKVCIGTGFLVGDLMVKERGKKKYGLYLITNKHVIKNKDKIWIGFNQNGGVASYDFPVPLRQGDICFYSGHVNPDVDIIAISINPAFLNDMQAKYHFFALDEDAYTLEDMKKQGVVESDLVYSLGYPLNLVGTSQKHPVCRLGCISRVSNLYIPGHTEVNFLVDAQSFPGNSGGPIILRPEPAAVTGSQPQLKAALIGILHSYIPYRDNLISQQTQKVYSIMQENSGLTNVHPVNYIKDVIEIEKQRAGNKITLYEKIVPMEQPQLTETVKEEEKKEQPKTKKSVEK